MNEAQTPQQGFTGTVNLQLADLIQMVCLSRSDLVIRVKTASLSGTIYVRGGQLYHAQAGTSLGEEAFFQIFRWKDGQFEILPYQDIGINSIEKPWEHLLLEAMRMRDEEAVQGQPKPQEAKSAQDELSELSENWELDERVDQVFDELELIAQQCSEEEDAQFPPEPQPLPALKVLVVDDSSFFARQLKKMIEADQDMEVVATARNGKEALDYLATSPPVDLITLDVQMPVMPGDTALKHVMIRYPIPVLMISSFQAQSVRKIFEFLQVGAVDFISKPEAHEDVAAYGDRLRKVAKRVAGARVAHFRRWRKPKPERAETGNPPARGVLAVVGAEGAYIDWFRLPLARLCRQGLVVGLQQLPDHFLAKFCQLLEEETRVKATPLVRPEWITPGSFFFGNASQPVNLELVLETFSLRVEALPSGDLPWFEGVQLWLNQLAEQAMDRMSVYLLSAAHPLPSDLIETLLRCNTQLILSPRNAALCTDLIDSIQAYSQRYPEQITWASPESLMEVWSKR